MRRVMLVFLVIGVVFLGFPSVYTIYYFRVGNYSTAVSVSNMGEEDAKVDAKVFDRNGNVLWHGSFNLAPYSSRLIDVSELFESSDESWGLFLAESEGLLNLFAVYKDDEEPFAVDQVIEPIQQLKDATYYWYSVGYVNKEDFGMGLIFMNPNPRPVQVYAWVKDSSGETLWELEGTLQPFSSAFVDLSEYAKGEYGVLDVRADLPINLATEFYFGGDIWTVDNIVDWYTYMRGK